jgi:hypothetical protein
VNYILSVPDTSWINSKHSCTMEIHIWKLLREQLYQECLITCLDVLERLRFAFSEMGTKCGSDCDDNFHYADLILLLKIQLQIWFKGNLKSSSLLSFLRHMAPAGSHNDIYSGAAVYIILSCEWSCCCLSHKINHKREWWNVIYVGSVTWFWRLRQVMYCAKQKI